MQKTSDCKYLSGVQDVHLHSPLLLLLRLLLLLLLHLQMQQLQMPQLQLSTAKQGREQ